MLYLLTYLMTPVGSLRDIYTRELLHKIPERMYNIHSNPWSVVSPAGNPGKAFIIITAGWQGLDSLHVYVLRMHPSHVNH